MNYIIVQFIYPSYWFCYKVDFIFLLSFLNPFPWMFAGINEICLRCSRSRMEIIFPPGSLWKTHKNTFNASTGLESKYSSTIIHKIKFNITSSSYLLPLLLFRGVSIILMLLYNRSICLYYTVQAVFTECKMFFRSFVILIIKEDSTKSTSFISVLS